MEATDLFAKKSKSWDMKSRRVQNAKSIAGLIVKNIKLHKEMVVMDFGAGTGLLSYFVAPYVGKIVAVDNSPSMLKEFQAKEEMFACQTEMIQTDLTTQRLEGQRFDGIISSMTLHHIEDIEQLLKRLYEMLHQGGFVALADLDSEDGTFHSDNSGVFHTGFDRNMLEGIATKVGFEAVHFETASIIKKPHRDFTVFLMTAQKR